MKKLDFVIISAFILIAGVLFCAFSFFKCEGKTVVISKNNKVVFEESIKKDKTVDLGTNVAVIENGEVYMKSANCKNQICVHHKKISEKGEIIVCLPNKISVEIK